MRYHLLIQSPANSPKSLEALDFVRKTLKAGDEIKQVFFYFQGLNQVEDLAFSQEWTNLIKQANCLKVCKNQMEKNQPFELPLNFHFAGLVDFFAEHWQDQGVLLQF